MKLIKVDDVVPPLKMNPLIVVGSHPCVYDEHRKIEKAFNDAGIEYNTMAINHAALYFNCDIIYSDHPPLMKEVLLGHTKEFNNLPVCWAGVFNHSKEIDKFPTVDQFFEFDRGVNTIGAASGWMGSLLGAWFGYFPVIMCGSPLDGSGINDHKPGYARERAGRPYVHDKNLADWHEYILETYPGLRTRIRSMSGWTREICGTWEI